MSTFLLDRECSTVMLDVSEGLYGVEQCVSFFAVRSTTAACLPSLRVQIDSDMPSLTKATDRVLRVCSSIAQMSATSLMVIIPFFDRLEVPADDSTLCV